MYVKYLIPGCILLILLDRLRSVTFDLVCASQPTWHEDPDIVVTKVEGDMVYAHGYARPLLNLATFDFLGLSQRPKVRHSIIWW